MSWNPTNQPTNQLSYMIMVWLYDKNILINIHSVMCEVSHFKSLIFVQWIYLFRPLSRKLESTENTRTHFTPQKI